MRFVQGNTYPGLNWSNSLEADFSGGYGFEMLWPDNLDWPWTSGRRVGDVGAGDNVFVGVTWGNRVRWSGTRPRLGMNGYTRDKYGTPAGGCTVRLFRTSTGEQVYQTTSDPTGWYELLTPYYEAHFAASSRNDTPKIQGVTADDLFPS